MAMPRIQMVRTHEDAQLPVRKHETDAAWDIFTPEGIELEPGERKRVTTGWKIGITPNKIVNQLVYDYDAFSVGAYNQSVEDFLEANEAFSDLVEDLAEGDREQFVWQIEVRPRSGNANKYGVTLANSPGTVDNPYRGPFDMIIINHGQERVVFQKGDRIAQMVLTKAYLCEIEEVEEFSDETDRGEGGFGHTGN